MDIPSVAEGHTYAQLKNLAVLHKYDELGGKLPENVECLVSVYGIRFEQA